MLPFSRPSHVTLLVVITVAASLLLFACAPAAAPAPISAPAAPAATSVPAKPAAAPAPTQAPAPAPATAAPTGAQPASSGAKVTLRFGGAGAPGSYQYVGTNKFKELAESASKGRIEVQSFEGNVGGETEILQRLQLGTLEGYFGSTGPLASLTKADILVALDLPYLFKDWDHYVQTLGGPVGKQFNDKLVGAGLRTLAWGSLGERILYQKGGPVNKPEDLKGMKIRVLENPAYIAWFKSIGVQPVAMAYPEVYTGLQLGTIDGVDSALAGITAKHYEVVKHLTLTNHVIIGYPFMVSDKWFSGLPSDLRDIVSKAAVDATAFEHQEDVKIQTDLLQQWKDKGVTVTSPDREAFRKTAEAIWPQFRDQIGKDVLDQLIALNK